MSRLENAATEKNKRLRTTPWMAAHVFPAAIRRYREVKPDLKIRLFDGSTGAIARRVDAGKLDVGLGIFDNMSGLKSESLFKFAFALIRSDAADFPKKASIKWSDLEGQTLISLTANYPYQHVIERQLKKDGVAYRKGQTVNLLDTQIGLVEAGEGMAVIPSFGLMACRDRMVIASELVGPVITQDFRQITNPATKLPREAADFCIYLKGHLAQWAGNIPRAGVR